MALALPAVIIALVGLIIAFAFFMIVRPPLQAIVNAVPLIGGVLANAMDGAIWWAYSQSVNVAAAAIRGVGEVFAYPPWRLHQLFDNAGAAASSAAAAAWRVRWVTIPLLSSQLTSLAYWARDAAIAVALQVETDVVGLVWNRYYAVEADLDTAIGQLTSLAYWARDAAIAVALQVEHDVVGLVWNRYQAVETDLASEASAITGLVAQVDTDLQGLIWDRWRAAEADAGAALGAAEAEIGRAIDGARAEARAEAGAAEAAGIAAAGVVAAELAQLMERDCIKFCNPLGGLGSILQDIEDTALIAALVALAAEGVRDPEGTAQGVDGLFGGLVGGVAGDIRAMAGV